jgi:hypothetical protein
MATTFVAILMLIGMFLATMMSPISDLSTDWWKLVVIASLLSLPALALWLIARRRLRNLVTYGTIVEGEVIAVVQDDDARGHYRVHCQACPPGSSTPIKLVSGSHKYNPARHHPDFSTIRLPIYLDPKRPAQRYFIDDSLMRDHWTPVSSWQAVAPREPYPAMPTIRTATTPSWPPLTIARRLRRRHLNRFTLRPGRITAVERQDHFGEKTQWRVRCEVYPPGSEQPIDCHSDPWPRDPRPVLDRLAITHLPVYLDPADVERYFVDLGPTFKQYDAHPESTWPDNNPSPQVTSKDSAKSPSWSTYPSPDNNKG